MTTTNIEDICHQSVLTIHYRSDYDHFRDSYRQNWFPSSLELVRINETFQKFRIYSTKKQKVSNHTDKRFQFVWSRGSRLQEYVLRSYFLCTPFGKGVQRNMSEVQGESKVCTSLVLLPCSLLRPWYLKKCWSRLRSPLHESPNCSDVWTVFLKNNLTK
jgi:hypothetical protein